MPTLSSPTNSFLRVAACTLACSVTLLSGCGIGVLSTAPDGPVANGSVLSGKAMGGQQPVAGSTVTLYAVGTTGYGTGATALATTTSANTTGQFSFVQDGGTAAGHYSCPSSSALTYLTVSGGDPTGTGTPANFNPDIKLVVTLGPCAAAANSSVVVNEATTAATATALQQYIDPITEQIGAPSTGSGPNASSAQTGFANAYATVQNLAQSNNGFIDGTFTPPSALGTVVATVESAKIGTMADILQSCVNTAGTPAATSACASLLAAATPPTVASATNFPLRYATTPTATDTFQAALFMAENPTDAGTQVTTCNGAAATTNIGCLFSLASGFSAFPSLAAAPADWTIAITYASNSSRTIGALTEGILSYPQRLGVDKGGNIWVTNNVTPANPPTGISGLTELSPAGGILQQVLTDGSLVGPRTPTFDPAGNVWVPNFGYNTATNTVGYAKTVVEYSPTTGTAKSFNVAGCPTWLAADGAGNMFVADCSTAVTNTAGGNGTPGADLEEIAANAPTGSNGTVLATAATGYSITTYGTIGVDSNFNLFDATGGTTILAFAPPYTGTAASFTAVDPEPLSIDSANNVFAANYIAAGGNVDKLSFSGGALTNAAGAPYAGGGLAQAELSAIDGAGNFWITNYTSSSTGYVVKFTNTGVAQSPTTGGYAHTFHGAFGIAIDPSGNVWVGNNQAYTAGAIAATGSNGGAAAGGFLTEIVGAAVPVITPIAAGLPAVAGGANKMATPPQ